MEKNSYFYVLHCKDGTLYGGYTTNLDRRLHEHNEGIGAKYTRPKSRRPLKMIYAETYDSKSAALKAEAAFKKKTRKKKEDYLAAQGIPFPFIHSSACVVKKLEPHMSQKEEEKHEQSEKL